MSINRITAEDVDFFARAVSGNNDLDIYQHLAIQSAIYPGQGTALGLIYCALKLNGEAGELAEHVGKAMRDDDLFQKIQRSLDATQSKAYFGTLEDERHQLLVKEIGDCLWYLSALCQEIGISLSDAALINLTKLHDRSERNKLQGEGDNR